ncbi:DUF6632 domain-containing protein [Paraburkholderia sp. EG287B]|uniref:DUF6632 domain-containing protein n=1 Tax=Paraburkholderia sp. EG287B TaxID=3237010 RepID=UPI0034D31F22
MRARRWGKRRRSRRENARTRALVARDLREAPRARPRWACSRRGFTVWSSVVHGAIMTVQSLASPGHLGHLLGDVPALFIVAAVLAVLTPRRASARAPAVVTGARSKNSVVS